MLCVDDDTRVLQDLEWLLAGVFDVVCSTDAREGRARLRCDDFEVVVSDLRMPGMLGTEFLHWARIESPNSMRLMLADEVDFAEVMDAVNACEVFRFLRKPWDRAQLLDTVDYAAAVARSVPLLGTDLENGDGAWNTEEAIVVLLDPDATNAQQVREALDVPAPLHWCRDMAEATALFSHHAVAVLMVETQIGATPTLDLIRSLKRSQPHAVAIAMGAERDAEAVIRLINEAQIFRFLGKPLVRSHTQRMIVSAWKQHCALLAHPLRTARHAVLRLADSDGAFA